MYIVWKFHEIRSSNFRVDRAHLWTSDMTWPKNWHISSNISGATAPIFTFFTPYESALRADDGSVAHFHLSREVAMATDKKSKNLGGLGVRSHPRSSETLPFDRAHMTSYSTLIETIRLSCTVFELWCVFLWKVTNFNPPHMHLSTP